MRDSHRARMAIDDLACSHRNSSSAPIVTGAKARHANNDEVRSRVEMLPCFQFNSEALSTRIVVRNPTPPYRWIRFHPTRLCEASARAGRLHRRALRNGTAFILFAGLADDHC